MREIDTPFSRHRKTFDDHIEVDLDIAIHGQQCETVQTLLAAACAKVGLHTQQGTDAPLAGASSHRKHAEQDQQNHNVRIDHEASPTRGLLECSRCVSRQGLVLR